MARRTLLLIAAVLLAAIGTGVLFLYVNSLSGADRGTGDTAVVVAAAETIPAGATITDRTAFVEVRVARSAVTSGRLVQRRSDLIGKVTNRELLKSQPVSMDQFGGAVKRPSKLTLDEGGGFLAVTVEVEDAARNADLLQAGNRVAVWVLDPQVSGGGRQETEHQVRLILPDVEILTIGSRSTLAQNRSSGDGETASAEAGSTSLVTLQVTQDQAGKIMLADVAGEVRLTLLANDTTPTPDSYGDPDLAVNAP